MKAQVFIFSLVLLMFIILVDLYAYRGISRLMMNQNSSRIFIVNFVFLALTVIAAALILWLFLSSRSADHQLMMSRVKRSMGFLILVYVPKLFFIVFLLFRDLILALGKLGRMAGIASADGGGEHLLSRADFILRLGILVAAIPFISIIHGIWKGKYNFTVRRIRLSFPNLPPAFEGLKIVQISDLHLGSFENNSSRISPAVDLINQQKPDLILFTGDLVNNLASEARAFVEELSELRAREGKFSILGNHDYGHYYQWNSEEELKANMEELFSIHSQSGFILLRNEYRYIEREGQKIALLGVENWGEPPFPQYGDLSRALKGSGEAGFKILMSHDPSHWDAVVRPESDIDLTLSGHTHGMQFAINIPGFKWSPVSFKYPRWSGLYREGNQYLYVNIGLGYIAFPGRVGTPPEISLFTLSREK